MHNLIQQFWPSTVDGLTIGSIYALIALGYTLVYGVLRLINFAHSEVFMIGTFGSLFMLHALDVTGAADRLHARRRAAAVAAGRHGRLGGDRGGCSSGSPTGRCAGGAPAGWPP